MTPRFKLLNSRPIINIVNMSFSIGIYRGIAVGTPTVKTRLAIKVSLLKVAAARPTSCRQTHLAVIVAIVSRMTTSNVGRLNMNMLNSNAGTRVTVILHTIAVAARLSCTRGDIEVPSTVPLLPSPLTGSYCIVSAMEVSG